MAEPARTAPETPARNVPGAGARPQTRGPRPYPFLPPELARGAFLVWLRRTHAWLGLWGAALGLLFGFTGILLNHKQDHLRFSLDRTDRDSFEVPVPATAQNDLGGFAAWFAGQLPRPYKVYKRTEKAEAKRPPGTDGSPGQANQFRVHALAPGLRLEATYVPGDRYASFVRTERDLLGILNTVHQAGGGLGVGWILLADSIAGAFFVLTLTGLLLWSKFDGPRLLALGLGTGGLVVGTALVLKYALLG